MKKNVSERILVVAPHGRDAEVACEMLKEAGLDASVCKGLADLLGELQTGAGCAVVTEEALDGADLHPISDWIEAQPEWSDFPFVLLTARGGGLERNPSAKRYLDILGNVTFLERPFHPTTFVSLAEAALRGRRRQYEARSRLEILRDSEFLLKASNDRFRAAIDAVQGVLWTTDAHGRMTGEQPGWTALTGQSQEEYSGSGWSDAVHPDDTQPTLAAWTRAMEDRRTFVIEHRLRRHDGEWRNYAVRAVPICGDVGEVREWVGVHTDITAQRAAEAALLNLNSSLENRLRYPLEVFAAMRAVWPAEKPMSVRISANDWMGDEGVTPDEAVHIARAFTEAGADLIDVSAGQTRAFNKPVYGRMFQTPFSDQIRNEARVSTIAVGNIYETDHVNSILAAGRADLVALARPHLVDPMWTLRAAAAHDYRGVHVPPPYLGGMAQLARNMAREAEMKA